MVAKALKVFGPHWLLGYDIGCSFGGTIRRSSLGPEFKQKGCCTCVNAFHGYSHCAFCQQIYHPLNITGMGLEDLETLEHLFSSSNQLASITRYMSPYRRHVFIDLFLQQWDHDKYQNLATMLHNNYVQALDILEFQVPSFKADIQALGLAEEDLVNYIANEQHHFAALGTETPEDLHAVAYVELLQKYRSIRYQSIIRLNTLLICNTVLLMTMLAPTSISILPVTINSSPMLPLIASISPMAEKQKPNDIIFGSSRNALFLSSHRWKR